MEPRVKHRVRPTGTVRPVKAQAFVQRILEDEVTELLGRQKSERRDAVDASPGYRNGHGKPRRLAMSCGTIAVRRPRVRGLEKRFESRILPCTIDAARKSPRCFRNCTCTAGPGRFRAGPAGPARRGRAALSQFDPATARAVGRRARPLAEPLVGGNRGRVLWADGST